MIKKMNKYNDDDDKIYPTLPQQISTNGSSFRLKKSSDILTRLENEEKHYAKIRKKYKRAQSVFQNICMGAGSLSVILSMSGLTSSLTGPGIIIGIPIAAIGGLCGVISVISGSYSKKLGKKVSKHEQTMIVAKSKINTIKDLVSKSLSDEKITDIEFELIISELDKFEELKQQIRHKNVVQKKVSVTPSESYINLIRKEIQESLIKRLQPSAPPEE